jgi:molybdate transport system ATP-binding protein
MDEPLAALDAGRKAEILPYLERLRDELGLPIIYVSHAIDEVTRLADWLVLLNDGKLAASGPVDEVMGRLDLQPLTGRYEAGAVLQMRVGATDPVYDLTTLGFAGGSLRVPRLALAPGMSVRVRIRARDVAIALQPPEGISIQNSVAARVVEISPEAGPIVELLLDAGGTRLRARITRLSVETLGLTPGKPVWALIKSVALDRHTLTATPGTLEIEG